MDMHVSTQEIECEKCNVCVRMTRLDEEKRGRGEREREISKRHEDSIVVERVGGYLSL